MAQANRYFRFVGEHRDERFVGRVVGKDALDHHLLGDARRGGEAGLEDLGHAPGCDPRLKLVLAELVCQGARNLPVRV